MILCCFCLEKLLLVCQFVSLFCFPPPPCPPILGTTDIMGQVIISHGGCPVHCRMLSRTSGRNHQMPVAHTHTNTHSLQTLSVSPGGQNSSVENHCPRGNFLMKDNRKIKINGRKVVSSRQQVVRQLSGTGCDGHLPPPPHPYSAPTTGLAIKSQDSTIRNQGSTDMFPFMHYNIYRISNHMFNVYRILYVQAPKKVPNSLQFLMERRILKFHKEAVSFSFSVYFSPSKSLKVPVFLKDFLVGFKCLEYLFK